MADVLLGKSDRSRRNALLWRRPPDRKTLERPGSPPLSDLAIREGDWKLLCDYDGARPELYDMAHDRAETTNLASGQPELVTRLSTAVARLAHDHAAR